MLLNRNEQGLDAGADAESAQRDARLPYQAPRLVPLGSFRDLTKAGGLTGPDGFMPTHN